MGRSIYQHLGKLPSMIDLDNQTGLNFSLEALEIIASSLCSREVELLIVDDSTIEALNLQHREKASATDVLSFPVDLPPNLESSSAFPLGSIVVASSFVVEKASYFRHSVQDELSLLFIHGMLHLLGYDHEVDNGEMRQKEATLIEAFALPNSLIIRTEEK
jgi:probable rRNA maturation factor